MSKISKYDETSIKSLGWEEHIRTRPGMYIGKLGDGSEYDDGIYVSSIRNYNYGQYFSDPAPARAAVEVSRLPKDALIEIDAIVVIP